MNPTSRNWGLEEFHQHPHHLLSPSHLFPPPRWVKNPTLPLRLKSKPFSKNCVAVTWSIKLLPQTRRWSRCGGCTVCGSWGYHLLEGWGGCEKGGCLRRRENHVQWMAHAPSRGNYLWIQHAICVPILNYVSWQSALSCRCQQRHNQHLPLFKNEYNVLDIRVPRPGRNQQPDAAWSPVHRLQPPLANALAQLMPRQANGDVYPSMVLEVGNS